MLLGVARANDAAPRGQRHAAAVYGALAVLALLAFAAAVILGVLVITNKD